MSGGPLAGRGIVITRPRERAGALAALVAASGGTPILFPAIEIREPTDPAPLAKVLDELEGFDLAIFVSPTAAERGLDAARARRGAAPWPPALRVAAIGEGTRRMLEFRGLGGILAPEGRSDSEALLAHPGLGTMTGRRVALFSGEGGRELLAETLAARGATVVRAACYRRARPDADAAPLLAAWSRGEVHAVAVTSVESLANLAAMLGVAGLPRLRGTALFATHERIAEVARRMGIAPVCVAGPGDAQTHAALVAYFSAAQ